MTDTLCVLLYAPLLTIDLILAVVTLTSDMRNPTVRSSAAYYLCMACWTACEIVFFATRSADIAESAYRFSLIFRSFSAVFMLMMVVGFYRIAHTLSPVYIVLLLLPSVVLTGMLLIPALRGLVFLELTVLSTSPAIQFRVLGTAYFHIHNIYNQLLVLAIFMIVYFSFRKLPKGYRNGTQFLFAGFIAYLVCAVLENTGLGGVPVNFVLVGGNICGVLFYFATLVSGRYDFLHIERREVFHYLDEGILILDNRGIILDANLTAQNLFHLSEIKDEKVAFDKLLDTMVEKGRVTRRQPAAEPGEILCFLDNRVPLFYEMQRQPISVRNVNEGKCVILTDRTNSQILMERMIEIAGEDPLTGLPNRYRYQELLRELDDPGNLPLSIIIADVNGLKQINDTLGHYVGDMLLMNTAAVLRGCCPHDGHVARIGGDEFSMLLPRCTRAAALSVMGEIDRHAADFPDAPQPSLAMGSATKVDMEQNIKSLSAAADKRMYRDKRGHRR